VNKALKDWLRLLPRGKNWGTYFDSKSRGSIPVRSQPPLEERGDLRLAGSSCEAAKPSDL